MTHFDFSAAGEAIVDLSGEDLTGVDFGRSDFSGAVLTGTVMKNASFKAVMFRETLLDGATIKGATLDDTRFIEASMRDTTLKGVKGGRCFFSYCDLRTVKHGDSSLALTSTAAAPLRFSYSTLNYALVGPVWRHMRFDWASIKNVPDEATIDAHKAILAGIALTGVTFGTSSKFDEAILRGASFVNATLPLTLFRGAHMDAVIEPDFAPTDFGGADLRNRDFTDSRCSHTNFSGARMDETQFNGATFVGPDFVNAYLRGAAFGAVEQKKMSGAKFDHAFLVDANFAGALRDANKTTACIPDAETSLDDLLQAAAPRPRQPGGERIVPHPLDDLWRRQNCAIRYPSTRKQPHILTPVRPAQCSIDLRQHLRIRPAEHGERQVQRVTTCL